MEKITAVIIDDELNNCENLKELLHKYCPEIEITGMAHNAADGVKEISRVKPALVFLDIQMPGGSGFDMLEQLKPIPFEVIFVTAFDQYAIRAIRFCAIDYLLKPVDILELQTAVSRAVNKIRQQEPNLSMSNLLANRNHENDDLKIALPTAERILFTNLSEIIRCLGDNNYTTVYLKNGDSVLVSKTLKEYEELLSDKGFLRVHQSHLINVNAIRSFEKQDGGYLKMTDGVSVPVSRQRKNSILAHLKAASRQ
ncbi:MAG: response regulator transcription factor [Prolixibacteraceae bacterium]|nr:response regulator transcription factor [Prolixibacteraceae bacterium]